MKVEDGAFLPVFEPGIAKDETVVFVGLAIAGFPVVELAGAQLQPGEELPGGDLGPPGPVRLLRTGAIGGSKKTGG